MSGGESDSGVSSVSGEGNSGRPPVRSGASMRLGEKLAVVQRQMSNIRAARNMFCQNVYDVRKAIERMLRNVSEETLARERSMKMLLREIGDDRIEELDRQLSICGSAVRALTRPNNRSIASVEEIEASCRAYYRSIGLVQSEELKLQKSVASPLNYSLGGEAEKGGGTGGLKRPWGICSDSTGRIIVADRGNNKILVLDKNARYLLQFGKSGSGIGEFKHPTGVAVDSSCRIIVSDKNNHRVQIFSRNGRFIYGFGERGTREGQFRYPWGVAVNGEDCIAVSDNGNRRVQLFDKEGAFKASFDLRASIEGVKRPVFPRGVAFESGGGLLVTDLNNGCVLLIDKEFATAKKWREDDQLLVRPYGIACGQQGMVAVVDRKMNCVQVFDEEGKLLRSIAGKESGLEDVCFHYSGRIIGTESGNPRMRVL